MSQYRKQIKGPKHEFKRYVKVRLATGNGDIEKFKLSAVEESYIPLYKELYMAQSKSIRSLRVYINVSFDYLHFLF